MSNGETSSKSLPLRIAVVGGGIGGLALALGVFPHMDVGVGDP